MLMINSSLLGALASDLQHILAETRKRGASHSFKEVSYVDWLIKSLQALERVNTTLETARSQRSTFSSSGLKEANDFLELYPALSQAALTENAKIATPAISALQRLVAHRQFPDVCM